MGVLHDAIVIVMSDTLPCSDTQWYLGSAGLDVYFKAQQCLSY
jgi:hypothetical protein